MERVDSGLRRKMKVNQPKHTGNVVSFQTRSERGRIPADDERRDNIIRILDLSKFEQPRPVVENSASMRANIVAMVLLGLLVFLATEDFRKLERSNLCSVNSECIY
jgi:hypothetical protein